MQGRSTSSDTHHFQMVRTFEIHTLHYLLVQILMQSCLMTGAYMAEKATGSGASSVPSRARGGHTGHA
jgi:hypothetical protein